MDDDAETTAPPPVQSSETQRDSVAPAALLAASANQYSPPTAPPKPARPLSALETIPASRYHHSLAPQVLSQSVPPPAPRKRGVGLLLAAAATLGVAAVAGFFALGGAKNLGFGNAGTGALAITAAGPGSAALDGVRVLVDGKKACDTSPCQLDDLSAGTHFVTVEADGYSKTAARAVSVERGGSAALDVELIPEPTAKPEAKPAEPKTVAAPAEPESKPAETAAVVAPTTPRHSTTARTARVEKKVASTKKSSAKADSSKKKTEKTAHAAAMGTLNINSIPVASVVLDGRPMGSTPLVGISVTPGPHSVVFIHPEKGRKAAGTTVKAGGRSTVAVRF